MKRISCFLLLSTLLASCATSARYSFGSVVTPTPVVTEINAPTATAVFTPTSQPTPPETAAFTIDALDLDPALSTALKKHAGLEASITAEAEGKFSTTVQVLNTQGQPVTETMQVDPNTLHEDLASKNEYGNTPVMTTVDGKKLYWIQEEKAWFAVEISPDANKPVVIPLNQIEVATRVMIHEFDQPFSQAAITRWKGKTGALSLWYEFFERNVNTHEGTKFAYLNNRTISDSDLTYDNSPIQLIDAWFTTSLPDGTVYELFPTKWLDPMNPRDPKPDEWKVIWSAVGSEIATNENNRIEFEKSLNLAKNNAPHWNILPIFKAQEGFFNDSSVSYFLPISQPSLAKLLTVPGNNFANLKSPLLADYNLTFDYMITGIPQGPGGWELVTPSSPSYGSSMDTTNPDYKTNFFPPDVQTLIFPTLLRLRNP